MQFYIRFSYFLRVRGIQQLIENRQKLIKKVVKIVVENENPKKWSKKRKNEVQGGVERVKCA